MTTILKFDEELITSKEYLVLNIIITVEYLYVIYYDIIGIPVIKQYPITKSIAGQYGSTFLRVGSINRGGTNAMALTNGSISIIRNTVKPNSRDVVIRDSDYKDLMSLIFRSKAINELNRFYCKLLC